jgi:hypothetical protein
MANKRIEHTADRGQHLTLDEIATWVQDAMRAGADGSTVVEARVSLGGKLQKIGVATTSAARADSTT